MPPLANINGVSSKELDWNIYYSREDHLDAARTAKKDQLEAWIALVIPEFTARGFVEGLDDEKEKEFCLRVTMLVYIASNYSQIPREHQLRAALAFFHKRDSLLYSGTGSGKTLLMVIALLLPDPEENRAVATLCPLKRLQTDQEKDFSKRYGIPTVAINENTPRSQEFYSTHVYDTKARKIGTCRHFIVTPEQLFQEPSTGHLPRFGHLLFNNQHFQSHFDHIFVDEAHFVHTAGLSHNGQAAFREAYGKLEEIKARLPKTIRWHAMTATLPNHMLKTLEKKVLSEGYMTTKTTSNRKNIMYALHEVVDSIDEMRNYRCFLTQPYDHKRQPRVLIFFDSKDLTAKVAQYLTSLLPPEERGRGIIRHYHSEMSEGYLREAHSSFTENTGLCKVMVATGGQAQGVDFPDVDIVCSVGVPGSLVEAIQRGGRGGRREGSISLFVVFYETWAKGVAISDYTSGDLNDPDRTLVSPLPQRASQKQRAPLSSIRFVQCTNCLRVFFAQELNDTAPDALDFYGPFCCSNHPDKPMDVSLLLPSPLFTQSEFDAAKFADELAEKTKQQANKYRDKADRDALDTLLIQWVRDVAGSNDPQVHHGYVYAEDILSFPTRKAIVWAVPEAFRSLESLKSAINESETWFQLWAAQIIGIVKGYDEDLNQRRQMEKAERSAARRAK
ncbi:ATP-dependent DNA helicase recQ [Coprinopsis cinerea AmutBmut pab1-1]|nr:ATP-dependent DNA helicase recQ [Coprinopsis cinerea AmutBmut pab1-1]